MVLFVFYSFILSFAHGSKLCVLDISSGTCKGVRTSLSLSLPNTANLSLRQEWQFVEYVALQS